MYPNSIYLSLKVVSILLLWGQSIYYLGTWILWGCSCCTLHLLAHDPGQAPDARQPRRVSPLVNGRSSSAGSHEYISAREVSAAEDACKAGVGFGHAETIWLYTIESVLWLD